MPELPEVETSRLGILPYLKGQKINRIIVRQPKLRWVVDDNIIHCKQQMIIDIQRRAKYLLMQLQSGWIVIHLGMSGSLRILQADQLVDKHDHIDLITDNGTVLRYTDPRRFGAWLWCQQFEELPQLRYLGVEPLTSDFNHDYLYNQRGCRKLSVKSWIMDSRLVVGIGNIYASESLFYAKIHPKRLVNTLNRQECSVLVDAIKIVLEKSIAQGGTTLKNFLQFDGKPGYFVQQLCVYGRFNQPCYNCNTLIRAEKINQRSTFYCPECQQK